MLAGVDGTKRGWLAVIEYTPGKINLSEVSDFRQLLSNTNTGIVVVDVPIGLADSGQRGADAEARKLLGRRACCVFSAPVRPVLSCGSREEASKVWSKVDGRKCTCQTWAILCKVHTVDQILRQDAGVRARVFEGHPEVSFALMNGGEAIPRGKKTPEGRRARRGLLAQHFPQVDALLAAAPAGTSVDLLDALGMLWTARRVSSKTAVMLPPNPGRDRFGLLPRIVA